MTTTEHIRTPQLGALCTSTCFVQAWCFFSFYFSAKAQRTSEPMAFTSREDNFTPFYMCEDAQTEAACTDQGCEWHTVNGKGFCAPKSGQTRIQELVTRRDTRALLRILVKVESAPAVQLPVAQSTGRSIAAAVSASSRRAWLALQRLNGVVPLPPPPEEHRLQEVAQLASLTTGTEEIAQALEYWVLDRVNAMIRIGIVSTWEEGAMNIGRMLLQEFNSGVAGTAQLDRAVLCALHPRCGKPVSRLAAKVQLQDAADAVMRDVHRDAAYIKKRDYYIDSMLTRVFRKGQIPGNPGFISEQYLPGLKIALQTQILRTSLWQDRGYIIIFLTVVLLLFLGAQVSVAKAVSAVDRAVLGTWAGAGTTPDNLPQEIARNLFVISEDALPVCCPESFCSASPSIVSSIPTPWCHQSNCV